jgi:hypothetical protein
MARESGAETEQQKPVEKQAATEPLNLLSISSADAIRTKTDLKVLPEKSGTDTFHLPSTVITDPDAKAFDLSKRTEQAISKLVPLPAWDTNSLKNIYENGVLKIATNDDGKANFGLKFVDSNPTDDKQRMQNVGRKQKVSERLSISLQYSLEF